MTLKIHTAQWPGSQLWCHVVMQLAAELPTCLHQKKPDLDPKKTDSSFKALTHKICITKHKTDVKTR